MSSSIMSSSSSRSLKNATSTSSNNTYNHVLLLLLSGLSFAAGAALALVWERRRRNDDARDADASEKILLQQEQQQQSPPLQRDGDGGDIDGDRCYLQRCHAVRQALSKPRHSNFRVACLLRLDSGDDCLAGANDEPAASLGGALCAERAALLAYRVRYGGRAAANSTPRIVAAYIVSDHPSRPLPPGCLCREYLYGHVDAVDDPAAVRIVLQSRDAASPPLTVTVEQLYPHASVLARCRSATESLELCQTALQPPLARAWREAMMQLPPPTPGCGGDNNHSADRSAAVRAEEKTERGMPPPPPSWSALKQLVDRARQAAIDSRSDPNGRVHPLAFGAAAAVQLIVDDDGSNDGSSGNENSSTGAASNHNNDNDNHYHYITAHQWTAHEYGCTQDAVCQLLAALRQFARDANRNNHSNRNRNHTAAPAALLRIRALVQADAHGVPHAPFAAGRAALVEFGFARVNVLVATATNDDDDRTGSDSDRQPKRLQLQVVRAIDLVPFPPELPAS